MPPPPHDFIPSKHRYRTKQGDAVSRELVKQQIDKLIRTIKDDARGLGVRVGEGAIDVATFEIEMRALLKSGHIVAASVGKGGRVRMDQSDWGWVGGKLKWQYQYLRKFVDKIEKGKITSPMTEARAQKYASSVYISFYQGVARDWQGERSGVLVKRVLNAKESCEGCEEYAGMGFIPVEEMPLLGELQCGDFCKCDLVFENTPDGKDG